MTPYDEHECTPKCKVPVGDETAHGLVCQHCGKALHCACCGHQSWVRPPIVGQRIETRLAWAEEKI